MYALITDHVIIIAMAPARKDFVIKVSRDCTVNAVIFYTVCHLDNGTAVSTAPAADTVVCSAAVVLIHSKQYSTYSVWMSLLALKLDYQQYTT